MKPLSTEKTLFLELLASAIWDREPKQELFTNLSIQTWKGIETIAQEQSVLAFVGNKVLDLPKECLPPREMCLAFALRIQMTEQANRKQNKELSRLKDDYDKENLPFVLIKGQSLAYYYPQPLLRACGDIDVYLYQKGDYQRANQWAKEQGYRLQGSAVYEQLYWRNGTAVENHLYLMHYGREKYDDALAQMLEDIIKDKAFARLDLNGKSYETLPTELNAIYIFIHILHHFAYLGIGFRQICDWLIFLDRHKSVIDIEKFTLLAERLDLLKPMELFALMAVEYLGASADIFPFALPRDKQAKKLADLILEDIFRGGNFGFETFSGRKFKNIWTRRFFMFHKSLVRSWKIGSVAPEHIRLTPIIGAITRLKLTLKSLLP